MYGGTKLRANELDTNKPSGIVFLLAFFLVNKEWLEGLFLFSGILFLECQGWI